VYTGTLNCHKHAQLLPASIGFGKCVRDTLMLEMYLVSSGTKTVEHLFIIRPGMSSTAGLVGVSHWAAF
jgi:hypothetical protein